MQTIPSNFLKQLDLKKAILYDGENWCKKINLDHMLLFTNLKLAPFEKKSVTDVLFLRLEKQSNYILTQESV